MSVLLRSYADLFEHDADFGKQEGDKEHQEDKKGGLHRACGQVGTGHGAGQQPLNRPGLAADFGHNPASLPGRVK